MEKIETKDKDLRYSLSFILLGACFGVVFLNVTTGTPIAGLAKELGWGELLYGIMLAIPIFGGIIQIFGSYLLEKTKQRKKLFLIGGFASRIPWIFIALLPLLLKGKENLLSIILFFLGISAIGSAILNVSFMSWIGELIPINIRGRFLSYRTMLASIFSFSSGLLIGWFLDTVKGIKGFSIIFLIATLFGLAEIFCFFKVYDPPMKIDSNFESINIKNLSKSIIQNKKFSKFLLFAIFWIFARYISVPYFNLYMLKYLKMSFLDIALYSQLSSNLMTILSIRMVGKLIDRFGNKPIALISSTAVSFLPFILCFAKPDNWIFYILIVQISSGIFWAAFDLTFNNFALCLSPNENRSFYIAILNFFVSTTTAIAYIFGGFIIEKVAPAIMQFLRANLGINLMEYHVIFILSGTLRFLSSRMFLTKIQEERAKSIDNLRETLIHHLKNLI